MTTPPPQTEDPLADLALAALLAEVWAARWAMALGALLGLACAAAFLALATPRYAAEMIVAPASPLSSAADASAHPADAFLVFMSLHAGPSVAGDILEGSPKAVEAIRADRAFPFAPAPVDARPSPKALSDYLKGAVASTQIEGTSLERLSYTHPDAAFAAGLLAALHAAADARIRAGAKESAAARIAYLEETLGRTANADHRRVLAGLLMEQEHIHMLATMPEPFAARVIEPPAVDARKVWPRTLPSVLIFAVLGAGAGFALFAIARGAGRPGRPRTGP
jgi:hypothetical protein